MTRRSGLVLTCAVLALTSTSALSALGQPSSGGRVYYQTNEFVYRVWRIEDGLPQNSVTAILQARDGYLWLGTRGGLARFDGINFVVLGLAEGLEGLNVRALCQDRHGALWIGTASCLSRYQGGRFTTFTTREGLAGDLGNTPLPSYFARDLSRSNFARILRS